MSKNNKRDIIDAIDASNSKDVENTELFANELEDRYNSKATSSASTASTAGSCWGTASTACSLF